MKGSKCRIGPFFPYFTPLPVFPFSSPLFATPSMLQEIKTFFGGRVKGNAHEKGSEGRGGNVGSMDQERMPTSSLSKAKMS